MRVQIPISGRRDAIFRASYFSSSPSTRRVEYIETHPDFIRPDSRRNEVLSKLKDARRFVDQPGTLKWGIPMPHDPGMCCMCGSMLEQLHYALDMVP